MMIIVTNLRHYEALKNAQTAIHRVIDGLNSGITGDFSVRIFVNACFIWENYGPNHYRRDFRIDFSKFASENSLLKNCQEGLNTLTLSFPNRNDCRRGGSTAV